MARRTISAYVDPEVAQCLDRIAEADSQYEVAERAVIESMDTTGLGDLGSEDAILDAATRIA